MLKAGFIGFGRMGITHYSILNSHPDVNIVCLCDSSRTMMNIVGKHTGARTYSDYRKMLQEETLDFVVISTPSDSHSEIIKAAADRNLHIFVEKPFALSAEDGREVLKHLEGKSIINQVGYVNRFNEIFVEVRKLLHEGVIGDLKNFSCDMYGATVLKETTSGWRGQRKSGGGCMYEFASHCLDLAAFMFGVPADVTGSVMQSVYSTGVEDLVSASLLYDSGYLGRIHVNWSDQSYRKPTNIVSAFGTHGRIVADKHSFKIYLRDADPARGFHAGWNTRYITNFAKSVRFYVRGNEFTRQLDYFVDCVKNGVHDNLSGFAAGHATDILMEKIALQAAGDETTTKPAVVGVSAPQKRSWLSSLRRFWSGGNA